MCYKAFTEDIRQRIQEQLGNNATVHLTETLKNNGKEYIGIAIHQEGQTAIPLLYLEGFYKRYQQNPDMDTCVKEIMEAYEFQKTKKAGETAAKFWQLIRQWEKAKQYIHPFLLSPKRNRELLKNLIHTPFLDLSICYRICLDDGESGWMSLNINSRILSTWGISKEDLHKQALANMEQEGYKILKMSELLGINGKEAEELTHTEDVTGFAILTNQRQSYGAAGILKKELLHDYANKYGCNLFLFPSSIHEFTLFIDDGTGDRHYMNQMVTEANEEAVLPEEQLGDHAYYYDREKDTVTVLG